MSGADYDLPDLLLSAALKVCQWEGVATLSSEDDFRRAYIGAFYALQAPNSPFMVITEAQEPKDFNKRLDFAILPAWPPRGRELAYGEMKFFSRHRATDYTSRMGARLSDIHLVHALAKYNDSFGVFFDLVLNPKLVGKDCYESLKEMCNLATTALYGQDGIISPDTLKTVKGLRAFARAAINRTPRKTSDYQFLFPPIDLSGGANRAKRGQAVIRMPSKDRKLISIGVRLAGRDQTVPYRMITTSLGQSAVCFAIFEPGGRLLYGTDELCTQLSERTESAP